LGSFRTFLAVCRDRFSGDWHGVRDDQRKEKGRLFPSSNEDWDDIFSFRFINEVRLWKDIALNKTYRAHAHLTLGSFIMWHTVFVQRYDGTKIPIEDVAVSIVHMYLAMRMYEKGGSSDLENETMKRVEQLEEFFDLTVTDDHAHFGCLTVPNANTCEGEPFEWDEDKKNRLLTDQQPVWFGASDFWEETGFWEFSSERIWNVRRAQKGMPVTTDDFDYLGEIESLQSRLLSIPIAIPDVAMLSAELIDETNRASLIEDYNASDDDLPEEDSADVGSE
jgi:hypothetical protein